MVRVFCGNSLELTDSLKLELGANRAFYDPPGPASIFTWGTAAYLPDLITVGSEIIDTRSRKLPGDMVARNCSQAKS